MFDKKKIKNTWTLFLDRDGVINHEIHMNYVHKWEQFVFYDGTKEAIKVFSGIFNRIIVVTNQKGVGKGLTLREDLEQIHANMIDEISKAGGKIDEVFYCPDLDDNSPYRKPNPGMGLQAKAKYPEINFSESLMVGNTLSDMEFGRNLGAFTVFIKTTHPEITAEDHRVDICFNSLSELAHWLSI